MTALEQLNAYLRKLEGRMRLMAATRGAAIIACSAVLLTAFLAWLCNQFAFAERIVLPVRILLYLSLTAAVCFGLIIPLLRLNRRWVAKQAERHMAGFDERLLTITERSDPSNPFTELLAEDALEIARRHEPAELAPSTALFGLLASAGVAASILIWLIVAAPGYWGYGASLLWAGTPRSDGPLYDITVRPGNKTVRRKSDQMVSARLLGFSSAKVNLFARYKDGAPWQQVAMQPQPDGNGYEFLFAGLSEPVDYYVSAGKVRSKDYKIAVKDLPSVKRLRVSVHYPAYLAIKDQVDDPGGDVRAVTGSDAEVAIQTDRPLDHGVLVMEDGRKLPVTKGEGNWYTTRFPVAKDGSYHVAVVDDGEEIRLSDDYFIEAKNDEPPTIKIVNPQRDPHVTPIEEMPVSVETADDFALKNAELHYSVNGGPEQTIPLLKAKGQKEAQGKTTLSFENFKVVPGDLVSFYATASDAKNTARTDMFFAQAEPFDTRFQQSQQKGGGGGGGAGNESGNISERQKEIIAATWNELKSGAKEKTAAAEEARFLSDVEGKLGQQAKTLADRMRSRELSGNSAEFAEFSKQMDKASEQMTEAVGQLKRNEWRNALSPEQKALQALTRAESLFRDIQVAYGRMGGGGGGSGSAGRDLERMFDLELDPEKNQYETGQSASSSVSQQQKDLQDVLERLKALARRQQELAAQKPQEQSAQQRWEQEMLRREAEQLQRQMEQMSQNRQQGQSGQSSQQSSSQQSSSQQGSSKQGSSQQGSSQQRSGSQQSASSSQGSQQGRQSASSSQPSSAQSQAQMQQFQQAMNELKRAQQEMRNAVSRSDAGAQQRASASLQAAESQISNLQRRATGDSLADAAAQAQQMAAQQRDFTNRLRQAASEKGEGESESASNGQRRMMYGGRWNRDPYDPTRRALPGATTKKTDRLADEKEQMAHDLEKLQRDLTKQAQSLASNDPQVSSKLRDALSGVEQQDLASHMKKNADWIRKGYGAEAWVNEQSASMSLDRFSKQLQDAQATARNSQGNPGNSGKPGSDAQRALQQLQQLKRDLSQQAARQSGGQRSQPGQPGQPGQQGQLGQPGQPGQQEGQGGGAMPGGQPAIAEAMQNLANLRRQLGPRSGRAYYDSEYAFRFLQDLQGVDPSELSRRLNREVLPSLERLEMDLRRDAGASDGSRVAASETTPDTYRDAVAEYFKKLSK